MCFVYAYPALFTASGEKVMGGGGERERKAARQTARERLYNSTV